MSNYSDLLKHPKWQKKRLEIMSRDDFKCVYCNCENKPLNVHHKYYEKDKNPWEYPDKCFITLCENCHEKLHEIDRKFKDFLEVLPNNFGVKCHGEYWTQYDTPNSFAYILAYVFDAIRNGANDSDFFVLMEGFRHQQDMIYMQQQKELKKNAKKTRKGV